MISNSGDNTTKFIPYNQFLDVSAGVSDANKFLVYDNGYVFSNTINGYINDNEINSKKIANPLDVSND